MESSATLERPLLVEVSAKDKGSSEENFAVRKVGSSKEIIENLRKGAMEKKNPLQNVRDEIIRETNEEDESTEPTGLMEEIVPVQNDRDRILPGKNGDKGIENVAKGAMEENSPLQKEEDDANECVLDPGCPNLENGPSREKSDIMVDIIEILSEIHTTLDALIPRLSELIEREMKVESCSILFFDEQSSSDLHDDCIIGAVYRTKLPIFQNSVQQADGDSIFNPESDETVGFCTSSILCVPILVDDRENDDTATKKVIGLIKVINKNPSYGGFCVDDQVFLDWVLSLTSKVMERTVAMQESVRTKNIITDINNAISVSTNDIDVLLLSLNEIVCSNLLVDRCTIFLFDAGTKELFLRASHQNEDGTIKEIRFSSHSGIAGSVFTNKEHLIINDPYSDPRFNKEIDRNTGYRTNSLLCTPIWNRTDSANPIVVGVAQALNKEQGAFTKLDLNLLEKMTAHAANALVAAQIAHQHGQLKAILSEISDAMTSSQELNDLLKSLSKIVCSHLGVERSAIFLFDSKSNELVLAATAHGKINNIRFPSNAGIAGSVFTSETALIIDDAYADSRFNQEIDRQTGFRTRSILCAPIWKKGNENEKRKVIGVAQCVNKIKGVFIDQDLDLLENMTTQAAHALEAANLTTDLILMKNYNECILESIGDGIISIDNDCNIAKVNKAAAVILCVDDPSHCIGHDMEYIFSEANDWIVDAVNWVFESGKARTLRNEKYQSIGGKIFDVNISLRPLTDEHFHQIGCVVQIEDVTREHKLHGTLTRYMSETVAEQLLEEGRESMLDTKLTVATVLFTGINGFSAIARDLGPIPTVDMLNSYFHIMTECVFENDGTLDKFVGDSLLAIFGAPVESQDDPDNAMRAAIKMQRELFAHNKERVKNHEAPLQVGIGITTGEIVSGRIGSSKRMDYASIGRAVNLAAQLEDACKEYGADIIVSGATVGALKKKYALRELDHIRVNGIDEAVPIYEVLDHRLEDEWGHLNSDSLSLYYEALSWYREHRFKEAADAFQEVLKIQPNDIVSAKYRDRCLSFTEKLPPQNWDGVWDTKKENSIFSRCLEGDLHTSTTSLSNQDSISPDEKGLRGMFSRLSSWKLQGSNRSMN